MSTRISPEARRQLALAALESAVDGVIAIAESGTILMVNPAAERIFGYSADELLGKRINMLMPPPYQDEHDQYLESYLETGRRRIIGIGREVEGRRQDGAVFPMDLAVTEVRLGDKRMFVGTVRDVTKRFDLEEQLRQAQKMEAIGRLGGGIAHDFNTLLGSIIGYSEMILASSASEDDALRRHVEQIHGAASRGADLTRQLLTFSRPRALVTEPLDLNALIHDIGQMVRRLIRADVDVIYDLDPALWPVLSEPSQLEQVLMNLLVNAGDAIDGVGRIEIVTRNIKLASGQGRGAASEWVRLTVSDTGCGMDEQTRNRAFEPFFTTKGPGEGTGLGLSTVYAAVRQNGGDVRIDSHLGEGCRIDIDLPRAKRLKATPVRRPAPAPGVKRDRSATVLLVEDDATFLAMLSEFLEERGCTVLRAPNPVRALDLLETHDGQVDLAVTDMVMPEMSGRELAERLSALYPQIRLVLMSGYSDEALDPEELDRRGIDFLKKPFSTTELLAAIDRSLDAGFRAG